MQSNDNKIQNEHQGRHGLPISQQLVLWGILIGYPLAAIVLSIINPPETEAIESRILQIYLPAIIIQAIILVTIFSVIIRSSGRHMEFGFGQCLESLGLKRQDISLLNIVIAVIFLVAATIFLNVISSILNYYDVFKARDLAYLLPRTPTEKIFWVTLSVTAGITEEICFRGYVITRMFKLTGRLWPGVIAGSISFGLGHLYQGAEGMGLIGLYGLMFALLFLARGSLVPCIIAHALQDIIAIFAL